MIGLQAAGWITTAQGSFGASLDAIRAQLAGSPRAPGYSPQGELSSLLTFNPDGKVGLAGTPSDSVFERLRGIGGGITWSFDSALCDRLLPVGPAPLSTPVATRPRPIIPYII